MFLVQTIHNGPLSNAVLLRYTGREDKMLVHHISSNILNASVAASVPAISISYLFQPYIGPITLGLGQAWAILLFLTIVSFLLRKLTLGSRDISGLSENCAKTQEKWHQRGSIYVVMYIVKNNYSLITEK